MKTFTINYPDSLLVALNMSSAAFEQEAKTALAVKLYEMGRLTSGQAAVIAGIPRVAFLLGSSHYGAATVAWDKEEMDAEFK